MNAGELLAGLAALAGAQDAGSDGNGIVASRLVNGVEYAQARALEESRLRGTWKRRQGGGATPLVLLSDDPEQSGFVRVLGPQRDGPLRRVRADSMLGLVERTATMQRLQAVRLLAEELDRLDTERIAGLKVQGLGTEHLYGTRLPGSRRWAELSRLIEGASRAGWRELLTDLGYAIETLPGHGYLATAGGHPVAVIHPRANAWLFARLDEHGRLPEGALVAECRSRGAPYGILAAGSRLRLLSAREQDAGTTTRYLELDAAALEPDRRPLLGLLAPPYLAEGALLDVLGDARNYGQELRRRLDRVLREDVLPILGRELGRWASERGEDLADDRSREELEAAALLYVFRALFLLYAESAGHLPMANPTYRSKSLTAIAARAHEERDRADPRSTALWDDVAALVKRMRTGHRAWELPAYNGDLFAPDAVAGAGVLERAAVPDAALAPALVALARDADEPELGIDFSGLEIGHLGYIYEGLLSLRLSLADRDFVYDARADRYRAPADGEEPDVHEGELLWLTNEGGRKSGGVYYTRTELVRHLVRGAVGPAFDEHLASVRELAARDPVAAAARLFDFHVLDPACGSAHFLVEVVDELADKIATLLGELALPAVREQLDALRARAAAYGAGIEDTALLKRLVLKRCVYGVDLSAMGVEIAKVSLWLSSFVPGLSLAYLDFNVQRGNALIGVSRPEEVGQDTLFGDALAKAIADAAKAAAELRGIDDATPELVEASRTANQALHDTVAGAERLFDLWTAEPLGVAGARNEALLHGTDLLAGSATSLLQEANALDERERFLHWPLAFPDVFARDRPGFDAVVGNPPWEEVTLEEPSFYARFRPGIRRGVTEEERRQAIASLIADRPDLPELLVREQNRLASHRAYYREAFEGTGGDPDLYKLFCQRYRQVLRADGALGVVLPRTTFVNKGSGGFRSWLFDRLTARRIDFLINRARWAFDSEPRYTVALVVAERSEPEASHRVALAGVAKSIADWNHQVLSPGVKVPRRAFGTDWAPPLLRNQAEAEILAKLRTDERFPCGAGRWKAFPTSDFHETKHKRYWTDVQAGRPFWKGESFGQWDPHGEAEKVCRCDAETLKVAVGARPGSDSVLATEASQIDRIRAAKANLDRARIAFSDVTQKDNSRTLVACLVPPRVFLGNTAPSLVFLEGDERAQAVCLAIMNSVAFDWQARRFAEIHVSFFILEDLRLPALDDDTFAALGDAAARLSCADERFANFAEAAGIKVERLDDEEQARLRADIDARVARAWGLTAEELEVVFEDFTLDAVPEDYRERVRRRYSELG